MIGCRMVIRRGAFKPTSWVWNGVRPDIPWSFRTWATEQFNGEFVDRHVYPTRGLQFDVAIPLYEGVARPALAVSPDQSHPSRPGTVLKGHAIHMPRA